MAAPRTESAGGRYLAAILAAAIFSARLDVGDSFSSALGCPFEILSCLGNGDCNDCLDALQSAGLTVAGQDFEVCSELYAGTCASAASVGCDTANAELVELLTCVAEDAFGCDDFTTCAEFANDVDSSSDEGESSSSDEGGLGAPSTPAPSFGRTMAPAAAGVPAPGSSFSPTAVPTGGDSSSYGDTAYPSASPTWLWSSMEDTAAPSASSLAPTPAADGLHGGIGGGHSSAPTAAPTTHSEGLDDRSDGANGGTLSATLGSGSVIATAVIVLATAYAFVGSGSPLAVALAI
ncbi:unnamed protein product [Scytosiphon promiscuus]